MIECLICFRQHQGGWQFQGKRIQWDMLRAPPVETPPYALHISDCSDNLKPGDHVEIQRRGITETHYGMLLGNQGPASFSLVQRTPASFIFWTLC